MYGPNEPSIRFSDEWLAFVAEHGSPGDKNSAVYFRRLPSVELRVRAHRDAIYMMNCTGVNYSYAVACAADALIRNGFDKPTPAEQYSADRMREIEASPARLAVINADGQR
jgi:hypothetical protein